MNIKASFPHDVFIKKMNAAIKHIDGYEDGMEVVSTGGGYEVQQLGASINNSTISGMLSAAKKQLDAEAAAELKKTINK